MDSLACFGESLERGVEGRELVGQRSVLGGDFWMVRELCLFVCLHFFSLYDNIYDIYVFKWNY